MTKNTMTTIYAALSTIDFENKDTVMAELEKELNRGQAEREAKAQAYEAAWDAICSVFALTSTPLTVAEIFEQAEGDLPEGFTKGKVQYGLTHNWADRVTKTEGKVNTYSMK